MKLMTFIEELIKSSGNSNADVHLTGTIMNYINEEIDGIISDFPERATFTWETTSTTYFHTMDFTGLPAVKISEIMIAGVGADKKKWKDLRGRVGDVL